MDNRTIEQVRKNETKLINEIKDLEQQCKKQKEVIDKTTEYCDNNKEFAPRLEDVLDILKGGGINEYRRINRETTNGICRR